MTKNIEKTLKKISGNIKAQAKIFGYKRISFKKDWEIKYSIPAKELFELATILALAEGNISHAQAIQERVPTLDDSYIYKVGRLKNGCATAYVTNEDKK